jgi:hypothetical protein
MSRAIFRLIVIIVLLRAKTIKKAYGVSQGKFVIADCFSNETITNRLGIPENGGILDAISKKRPLEGLSKV